MSLDAELAELLKEDRLPADVKQAANNVLMAHVSGCAIMSWDVAVIMAHVGRRNAQNRYGR